MKRKIVIFGSYNVGLFLSGDRIPGVGETVIGERFTEGGGGKGSNQALAAAVLGADVAFVGRVGDDRYGRDALALYGRLGVSAEHVIVDGTIHSGISVIFIDREGSNSIMVVPGANANLSPADIDREADLIAQAGFVGFQLENALETVLHGLRRAHGAGAVTLLDPAPAQLLPEAIYPCIDIIKPNEHEASILTGIPVTGPGSALEAGRWFRTRGVRSAVVTLGGNGAVLVDDTGEAVYRVPRLDVPVCDTTGAGDCFSGALLCRLAEGVPMREAIPYAMCAASLSTTRPGVVESLPRPEEVRALADAQGPSLMIREERR